VGGFIEKTGSAESLHTHTHTHTHTHYTVLSVDIILYRPFRFSKSAFVLCNRKNRKTILLVSCYGTVTAAAATTAGYTYAIANFVLCTPTYIYIFFLICAGSKHYIHINAYVHLGFFVYIELNPFEMSGVYIKHKRDPIYIIFISSFVYCRRTWKEYV